MMAADRFFESIYDVVAKVTQLAPYELSRQRFSVQFDALLSFHTLAKGNSAALEFMRKRGEKEAERAREGLL